MAYRRYSRSTGRGRNYSRPPRSTGRRRTSGRRTVRRGSSRAGTIRIELVTGPTSAVSRPELLGMKQAAVKKRQF